MLIILIHKFYFDNKMVILVVDSDFVLMNLNQLKAKIFKLASDFIKSYRTVTKNFYF